MPKYLIIGNHAEDLGDGQMLEPGAECELSAKEAEPYLEAGILLKVEPATKEDSK